MNLDDAGMINIPEGAKEVEEAGAKEGEAKEARNHAGATTVSFDQLSPGPDNAPIGKIDLVLDLPLQVTVELGRTNMLIRDILDLGPGSVIELDRIAGEPVDVLANGKLIAKGEVVVVDESFGVRIVDIVAPGERISQK